MNLPPLRRQEDEGLRRRQLRKGMYLLPSLFTTANIAAGYYALSQTMLSTQVEAWHFDFAARAIGFAILFDGFDGRIARMTNTTSAFGKELDSLADSIAFGVAPALLAWKWGFRMLAPTATSDVRNHVVQFGAIATFLFLVACVSRLARFNIQLNPRPSNPGRPGRKYFVGMPTPAGAGLIAATVHFSLGEPLDTWWWSGAWAAFILAGAFLMVSTWRFFNFGGINLRQRHPMQVVLIIAILIASIWVYSQYVLFFIALTYMLSGVLARLSYVVRRRSAPPPPPLPSAAVS